MLNYSDNVQNQNIIPFRNPKRKDQESYSFNFEKESSSSKKIVSTNFNAADSSKTVVIDKSCTIEDAVNILNSTLGEMVFGNMKCLGKLKAYLHYLVSKFKETVDLRKNLNLITKSFELMLSFKNLMTAENWDLIDLSIRKSVQLIFDNLLQIKYDYELLPVKLWKRILSNLLEEIANGNRLDSLTAVHFFYEIYINVGAVHEFVHEMISQQFLESVEAGKPLDNLLELIDKVFYNSIDSDPNLLEFFLRSIVFVFLKAENLSNYSEIFISYLDLILSIDSSLIYSVVQFLLRYWPRCDTTKSCTFADFANYLTCSLDNSMEHSEEKFILFQRICFINLRSSNFVTTSSIIPLCEWFYIRTQEYPHLQKPIYDYIKYLSVSHKNSVIKDLCKQYVIKADTFSNQK